LIAASLARTRPSYAALEPPWCPGDAYPEIIALSGEASIGTGANPVYSGVRAALRGLELDSERFGEPDWNPLGDLVRRGERIALKPNFIRHWNPNEGATVESVITHGAILRAMADYAWIAVGPEGRVEIVEAAQMDCKFSEIRTIVGLDELQSHYRDQLGLDLAVIDLRREEVEFSDGIIVSRETLDGDPRGYRKVDLGAQSFFTGSGLDPDRLRGADYDSKPTGDHHRGGRNEYLLSESVLSADLVINLPKMKTHKKTGVTLALKNLVGINGDKNWLPHHSLGAVDEGGDEFPGTRRVDRWRSQATEWARPLLKRGVGLAFFRAFRRVEDRTRGSEFIRAGNWYGNRTTWRMCLDLNRCLYYSDSAGLHLDAAAPVRRVLTVIDGIVAGEGSGPLSPSDRPLGAVIASTDPVAADLVALRLMGFDEERLPKIREAMLDAGPRITSVSKASDVRVSEVDATSFVPTNKALEEIESDGVFASHPGWVGHVEREIR
jgi:uncharacterized protein (DUF362 family)